MAISKFRFPTQISFGSGAINLVPQLLRDAKVKRPLLVTDHGLASSPMIARFLTQLRDAGLQVGIYSEAAGNPLISHVDKGVRVFRSHDADAVVSIGGGCALDVGKAIALMSAHPGNILDYEDDKPGGLPVRPELLPMTLSIPTTAGTGSEVGGSSVVSRDDNHQKVIVWGPGLIPRQVIADPDLTTSLPPAMTAATGMDALTHNVEAYLAKNYHPICEGIALEGIRLVSRYLVRAFRNPSDSEARGGMLMASMMGAIAFQKGLGVTHSCAHALSTCYDLHHGLANAVMIVPCMEFNFETNLTKFATMGEVVGCTGSERDKALGFMKWLQRMCLDLQIPDSLASLKVKLNARLLDVAVSDACHANNPRVCTRNDFEAVFLKGGAIAS